MRYNTSKYQSLISSFAQKKVLVIGDLLLDKYLRGNSTRLCPEAPVPVVDVYETTLQLGGAGNTACNLAALGAEVFLCCVCGQDDAGEQALELLRAHAVHTDGVITEKDRRTQSKSRIVAGSQLITRIDEGSSAPVDRGTTSRLYDYISTCYPICDAIIVSDYNKGLVTEVLIDGLRFLRERHKAYLAIDSKRLPFFAGLRPDCIKPNYDEATGLLSLRPQQCDRADQIGTCITQLVAITGSKTVAVSLDADGVVTLDENRLIGHIPAPRVARPQVSGAGDSFLSAFVLAKLAGGDMATSAEVGVASASIAIAKPGTGTSSPGELKRFFNVHSKYVNSLAELRELCDIYHADGKRIVFTNGCFDILHSGHVSYLHRAHTLGDILIVGLNNDASIRRLKGPERPINTLPDRLQVLAGLSSVDHIIAFGSPNDDTPIPLIRAVRPHIFAKGGDYSRDDLPEAGVVEANGGQVVLVDHVPDYSTTRIINRIRHQHDTLVIGHGSVGKL